MVDFALYRLTFAPAVLAFVALMFSLQGVPAPFEAPVPPSFDPARATATAREIVSTAPERPPGSPGDGTIADLVADRFGSIPAGSVSEQAVNGSYDGEDVTVRNVLVTLPGDSARTVLVLAGRDSPSGPGDASSAAATAALVELAATLGASGHAKTYVLASTSGYVDGAAGARAVVDALAEPDLVDAVVVISQPGAAAPSGPYVVGTSTGPNRTAAQLRATATAAVLEQAGLEHSEPGTFSQLARLAFPSGAGLQAPIVDAGFDAIAISAAGETPLPAAAAGADDFSRESLGGFGRAAMSVIQSMDVAAARFAHGPEPYVGAGDNLVPGWTIALLALALLLPAWAAAADAVARSLRRGEGLEPALAWGAGKAAPAVAGLVALYVLALGGLVPDPEFPFDFDRYGAGAAGIASMALIAAAMIAAGVAATARRRAPRIPRSALLAAAGAISGVAGLGAWLANPYLGLLVAPAAHAWLAAVAGGRLAVASVAVAVSLVPLVLALGAVASALELGGGAPWTFLLMVADHQIGFLTALSLSVLTGGLAATIAAAPRRSASG